MNPVELVALVVGAVLGGYEALAVATPLPTISTLLVRLPVVWRVVFIAAVLSLGAAVLVDHLEVL